MSTVSFSIPYSAAQAVDIDTVRDVAAYAGVADRRFLYTVVRNAAKEDCRIIASRAMVPVLIEILRRRIADRAPSAVTVACANAVSAACDALGLDVSSAQ